MEIENLTEQELAQWTDYVNSRENNAFLLSYYDEPKQIDYLENEEVVSVAIRSYMLEYDENEEEIYTYYLSDWDTPALKEEWEKAGQNFLTDKEALDLSICWKSLYETEIREKKVLGWFLLMAESLDGAV